VGFPEDPEPVRNDGPASGVPSAGSVLGRQRILQVLGYREEARFLADYVALTGHEEEAGGCYERVAQALRLEGEGLARRLPEHGETGLASRLVKAQLVQLGASFGRVEAPFGEDDDSALLSIGRWVRAPGDRWNEATQGELEQGNRRSLVPVLRMLASAKDMIEALIARDPTGFLVAPAAPQDGQAAVLPVRVFPEEGSFIESVFDRESFRFGPAQGRAPLFETAFDGDPSLAVQDHGNDLGLRLIQIWLQRDGFYRMTVDGRFQAGSWSALTAAAQRADVASAPIESVRPCFRVLPGGFAALSLQLVYSRILDNEAPASEAALRDQLFAAPGGLGVTQAELVEADDRARALRPAPSDDGGLGIFRSVRSVLAGAVDAVRSFFHQTKHLVERMFEPVADLLSWLRRKARQLVDAIWRSLVPVRRLLFGEPWADAGVLSRISSDRDATLFVAVGASPEVVRHHLAELRMHNARFLLSARVIAFVVAVFVELGTGPIGWLRLVLRVLRDGPDLFELAEQAV
jgi:hypothetical protein